MKPVCWLQDLGKDDGGLAGGKAANLGEMLRAGLPVPPGFVVTTAAYDDFLAATGLREEIERLTMTSHPDDAASLEATSQAIAARFAAGALPEAVVTAVREAYARMGEPAVAVRSSATTEDLPDASFAGQMESYLNVRGEEALKSAVRRCWASLWTPRALSYRARQGISHAAVSLAVLVQELMEAEAAGVLFTANPVSGHRGQVVIDAVWGLGEALVSGRANPDHWVVDAASGKVLEARTARKEVMSARQDGGTATAPVPPELRVRPVLDAAQLAALVALGRRAAAHFGSPQDVEWALAKGRLSLLQSRPITSLFPLPQPEPPPEAGLRVYLCGNVVQGVVEPITPMGIAVLCSIGSAMAKFNYGLKARQARAGPPFKAAAGRVFADITVLLRHPRDRQIVPRLAHFLDHHVAAILNNLRDREPRLRAAHRRLHVRLPFGFVLRLLARTLYAACAPDAGRRHLVATAERFVRQAEERIDQAQGQPVGQLLDRELTALWPALLERAWPLFVPGVAARFLAEAHLRRWLNDPAALQPVLRSLPHNPTMEMDLELWRISRTLKAEGVEPSADHPAVRAFLARYGHRAVREIDVGMPRWRDDPAHVLNVLKTYLGHRPGDDPERRFREGEQAAEEALAALVGRVRRRKGWLRARLLRFLLRRVRALAGLRELPKFLVVHIFAAVRVALAQTGAALVDAGRLDRAEDVFFLDANDLESSADLRAVAAQHRADYDRELSRKVIPRVMTSEGETFYTAPDVVPGALAGTGASPGVYEGQARVILDPRGAKLVPGEVLVAASTDPAWTPLFLSAGALVMELGGVLSHGSVVAREYGIPAVVGVPEATRRLQTGQRVRVDGESGQVVLLDRAAESAG
jgi:pyruvate,water dikinase